MQTEELLEGVAGCFCAGFANKYGQSEKREAAGDVVAFVHPVLPFLIDVYMNIWEKNKDAPRLKYRNNKNRILSQQT